MSVARERGSPSRYELIATAINSLAFGGPLGSTISHRHYASSDPVADDRNVVCLAVVHPRTEGPPGQTHAVFDRVPGHRRRDSSTLKAIDRVPSESYAADCGSAVERTPRLANVELHPRGSNDVSRPAAVCISLQLGLADNPASRRIVEWACVGTDPARSFGLRACEVVLVDRSWPA
jgi:hypothetical protein